MGRRAKKDKTELKTRLTITIDSALTEEIDSEVFERAKRRVKTNRSAIINEALLKFFEAKRQYLLSFEAQNEVKN